MDEESCQFGEHWALVDEEEVAQLVYEIGTALYRDQSWRRQQATQSLRRFEPDDEGGDPRRPFRVTRYAVDTVVSQISGNRPKPTVLTNGASWKQRRKAKKFDKAVEGVLNQSHDGFSDFWELAAQAATDSGWARTGVLQACIDEERETVEFKRVYCHDLYVDPLASKYGRPRDLFKVTFVERDELRERFNLDDDDAVEAVISTAKSVGANALGDDWNPEPKMHQSALASSISDLVMVVESWHIGKEGRHVVAVDSGLILDEDWTRPEWPFVFFHWSRSGGGWWGKSAILEMLHQEDQLNRAFIRANDSIALRSGRRTYYNPAVVKDIKLLESNEIEQLVPVSDMGQMPKVEAPNPVSRHELDWVQQQQLWSMEMNGISLQQATARKEAGLESGEALRTMTAISNMRQSRRFRAYERLFVDAARQINWCFEEMFAEGRRPKVRWPKLDFFQELEWGDVRLSDSSGDVVFQVENNLTSEPAGRIGLIEQLYNSKIISAEAFRRLIQWPDLEKEFERDNSEHEYVEWLISKFLDADEGDSVWKPPSGFFLDMPSVFARFASAYFQAERHGAPEFNLSLLRKYLQALEFNIKQANMALQQQAHVSGAQMRPGQVAAPPPQPGGQPEAPMGAG